MQLQTRHLEWIFSAAQDHFVDQINKLETENLRHAAATTPTYRTKNIHSLKSRAEKTEANNTRLEEYDLIVGWLDETRERVMNLSAEEFAKAFWAGRAKPEKLE